MKGLKAIGIGGVVALSLVVAAPASAAHEHYLVTPGTCVADIARGQTAKGPEEGGYHKFHENVHKGQPGTEAFNNPNNRVSVDKGSCPAE